MEILPDTSASGGSYIVTPQGSGDNGSITLTFCVSSAGNYFIWGRSIAPSGTEDSFILQVDAQPDITWDIFQGGSSTEWKWDMASSRGSGSVGFPDFDPYVVYLDQGIHNITVKRRDPGTKLDKLIITKNPLFLPIGKEEVSGYPSDFSGISRVFLQLGTVAGDISVIARMEELPGQEVNFQIQSIGGSAYRMEYVSGNNQSGGAGNPLALPFEVRTLDQFGNVVSNFPVNFIATQGNGGFVQAQPVQTDNNGVASATLILATDLPENRVEARGSGLIGSPVEFIATASSGFPTKIEYVSGNNQNGGVAQITPLPLVVKVLDNENNPISGYTVSFENRSALGGSLSDINVQSDLNGEAKVFFTFATTMGEYQVAAIGVNLVNSPILFSLNAGPGLAYQLTKISGDSTVGISSRALINPFVVQVQDQYGNAKSGESVTFVVIEGDGNFGNNNSQVVVNTDLSGNASVTLTLGPLTGNYNNKVRAIKTGLQGSPVEFIVSALPPTASHLVLYDGDGQLGVINNTLPAPLRVRVSNAVDEPAVNHPVVFHVISGGGIFMGSMDTVQTIATNSQGIAEVPFKCGPSAGENVNVINVTSKVGSTPLIGSPVLFNVSARYLSVKITEVRGNNQMDLINSLLPVPLEVLVVDDQDNPVVGQLVEFHLQGGGGKLDGGNDTLVVKNTGPTGKTSVQLTLGNEPGLNNNIVQVFADDGFQSLQGSPLTFQATATKTNAVNLVKLGGDSQSGTVGKTLNVPIKVKVTDNFDQPVAGQDIVFRISAGAGMLQSGQNDTLLTIISAADGVAQVNWILGTKVGQQNNQLQVSADNGAGVLTGSPLLFSASAQADITDPGNSEISASSPVIANGQDKSTVTVKLFDKYYNPITGNAVELSSGQNVFFQQPVSVTDDSGKTVGYITSIRSGVKTVYARNSNDNVLLNNFAQIEFTPSQASYVIVTAGSDQYRNVGTALLNPFVVTVTDDFNNPIANYPVTYKSETGNGIIIEPQPVFTDSFGMAFSNYILSDTPGDNLIKANAGALTGSPAYFTAVGQENPAHRILYRAGNSQIGIAGQKLADNLSVWVFDAVDNPVKNVEVLFEVSFGGGEILDYQPVNTNAFGVARTSVRLGTKVGTDLITAASDGLIDSPFTFVANIIPDQPSKLEIAQGDNQNVSLQSQSQPMTVIVMDQYGNPFPNAQVRFEVLSGAVTMVTSQPARSNSQGNASSSILTQTTSGTVVVKASLVSSPSVFGLFNINIQPATPENLLFYGSDPMIVTFGQMSAQPLQALVTDRFNNPVPNVKVNFNVSSGDASIFGEIAKYTDTDGHAICYILVGNGAAPIEVFATSLIDPEKWLIYHLIPVSNNIPAMTDIPNLLIWEMESIQFPIFASDPDGDSLGLSIYRKPEGVEINKLDNSSWQFDWTPDYNQSGVYPLVFTVFDVYGGAIRDTVTIEVLNLNRKPVITHYYPPGDTSLVPGQEITFNVEVFDYDGESLSILWYKNSVVVSDVFYFNYKTDLDFTGLDNIIAYIFDQQDTVKLEWVITVSTEVEMADLRAVVNEQNNGIVIHWQTTKEANNLGFEVWRSVRKENFYRPMNSTLVSPNDYGEYSFIDDSVQAGIRYYYKVVDHNVFGAKTQHGPVQVLINLPAFYQLEQNYPNPFMANLGLQNTTIKFQLPKKEWVLIRIFNVLGQQVRTLAGKQYLPGYHNIQWNGRDNSGRLVTSGIYYYQFSTENFKAIKRLVLIR